MTSHVFTLQGPRQENGKNTLQKESSLNIHQEKTTDYDNLDALAN